MKKLTPKFIISILNLSTGLPFFFIPKLNHSVASSLSEILPTYFVTINKTKVDMEKKLIKLTYSYNTTPNCTVSEGEVAEELIQGIRNNIVMRGVTVVNINKLRILLKDFKLQAGNKEIKIFEDEQNTSSCGYTY